VPTLFFFKCSIYKLVVFCGQW